VINTDYSEFWKKLPWRKLRKNLFRLQCRLYKAVREGDKRRIKNLQKLILRARAARFLAIRQVTQLNAGKRTAGVDGKSKLSFKEKIELEKTLRERYNNWKHRKLREIAIPKKDGSTRILKVPTIADRTWQCLIKFAIEPAHEALFHERSYGFRPGRSAHDAQKFLFVNLRSNSNGIEKRILEIDLEKCFDRISHNRLMERVIVPRNIKLGLWRCLKAGANPEFPERGVPQGGPVSPLLANIALHGIEEIHTSVRYADDMVYLLKPNDDAEEIWQKLDRFLAERGLNVKESKTRLVRSTEGFSFLGWNFKVRGNGKFECVPSKENYRAFRKKVKEIVNHSNYGAARKAEKLAPLVRGWRNYHKYCDMSRFNLWHLDHRTFQVFNKEKTMNGAKAESLVKKAFPAVSYQENRFVMVKGCKSPFDGDIVYWSKRQSKLYDGATAKALIAQKHTCGYCGLKFVEEERIHLHHLDGNHDNWKTNNLLVIHHSCHHDIHRGN
jgi:group II intron reverse transcriptase/maturase